jgi:hypothetical protein
MEVSILPLVEGVTLPAPAPAVVRSHVPPGYGVQEQCLPFTAATALGFLIKSPFTFGYCLPTDLPPGVHALRGPLDDPADDPRVFYVKDDPGCRFARNAFSVDPLEVKGPTGKQLLTPVQPGLSFFDRKDQVDLFKIHLPYIWRTPADVDTLFLPAINRPDQQLLILSGLVETDWYAHSVNLVSRKPPADDSIHVSTGDVIAQAILVDRSQRRPLLKVLASHSRLTRDLRTELVEWYKAHGQDRSAYKKIARSQDGRVSVKK